jgi:hypothetical protein
MYRPLRYVSLALILAASVLGLREWFTIKTTEQWREAVAAIEATACQGSAAVFYAYFSRHPFDYYAARLPKPNVEIVEIASEPYRWHSRDLPAPSMEALAALRREYEEVWLVRSHEAALGNRGSAAHQARIQSALAGPYRLQQTQRFAGIRADRYVAGAASCADPSSAR